VFRAKKPYVSAMNAREILGLHGFDSDLVKVEIPTDALGLENQGTRDTDVHLLRSEAFPNGVIGYRNSLVRMMLRDGPSSKPPKWDNNSTTSVL